jgi:hypothetical protein
MKKVMTKQIFVSLFMHAYRRILEVLISLYLPNSFQKNLIGYERRVYCCPSHSKIPHNLVAETISILPRLRAASFSGWTCDILRSMGKAPPLSRASST